MKNKYFLQVGTYIGSLYKDFYTDQKTKEKKIRYKGYLLLGIFSGSAVGMDITLYEIPEEKNYIGKKMYAIKSGRKQIGFFIKETGVSSYSGKEYHYLKGKINIGGLDIKINAYQNKKNFSNSYKKIENGKEVLPDFTIELAQPLKCGIVKLG